MKSFFFFFFWLAIVRSGALLAKGVVELISAAGIRHESRVKVVLKIVLHFQYILSVYWELVLAFRNGGHLKKKY